MDTDDLNNIEEGLKAIREQIYARPAVAKRVVPILFGIAGHIKGKQDLALGELLGLVIAQASPEIQKMFAAEIAKARKGYGGDRTLNQ